MHNTTISNFKFESQTMLNTSVIISYIIALIKTKILKIKFLENAHIRDTELPSGCKQNINKK